jgi:hypothetical protein
LISSPFHLIFGLFIYPTLPHVLGHSCSDTNCVLLLFLFSCFCCSFTERNNSHGEPRIPAECQGVSSCYPEEMLLRTASRCIWPGCVTLRENLPFLFVLYISWLVTLTAAIVGFKKK